MSVSSPLMPVRCASPATPSHSRCSSRSSLTSVKAAQSWRIVSSDSDASERAGMPGFDEWESFYVIVGAAAGALIGLQFVVMTLLADKPQLASPEAGAAFATPNVVHFSAALLLSALMRVPWHSLASAAEAWGPGRLGGSRLCGDCDPPHAVAANVPARLGGLDLPRHAAAADLRVAPRLGARRQVARGRRADRCRSGHPAAALHRHPQLLGHHRVPRAGTYAECEGLTLGHPVGQELEQLDWLEMAAG